MHKAIPALPVRNVGAAVARYRDRFGFQAPHETAEFAVLVRDDAVLHVWAASDEEWRSREDLSQRPVCSGAKSFLAGTGSCRVERPMSTRCIPSSNGLTCCTRFRQPRV